MGVAFALSRPSTRSITNSDGNCISNLDLTKEVDLAALSRELDDFEKNKTKRFSDMFGSVLSKTSARYNKLYRPVKLLLLYMGMGLLAGTGGIIFQMCEYSNEESNLKEVLGKETSFNELLVARNYTANQTAIINQWVDVASDHLEWKDTNVWELRYASFFAATTFTTIGYGLQSPVTPAGRAMTFFYGLPSIVIYGMLARNVGLLVLQGITGVFCLMMTKETYKKHKFKLSGCVIFILFNLMSWLILYTATDEGFGNGIYTYSDAFYFMFTTTSTIGYGDVMMSGSNPFLTVLIGIWMASTCGVIICFLNEASNEVANKRERQNRHISRIQMIKRKLTNKDLLKNIKDGKIELQQPTK